MIGSHHQLNGHDFEQTPGGSEGQGSLASCSPWGCRVRHDLATEQQQFSSTFHLIWKHSDKGCRKCVYQGKAEGNDIMFPVVQQSQQGSTGYFSWIYLTSKPPLFPLHHQGFHKATAVHWMNIALWIHRHRQDTYFGAPWANQSALASLVKWRKYIPTL